MARFTKNRQLVLIFFIFFLVIIKVEALKSKGEPVPGAEIYIELEGDDKPIMKGKTDHIGTYHFKNLKNGNYKLVMKIPKEIDSIAKKAELTKAQKRHINFIIEGAQRAPITFGSKTGKNPLCFESPNFILKDRVNSIKVTIVMSGNNYGINDDGIK